MFRSHRVNKKEWTSDSNVWTETSARIGSVFGSGLVVCSDFGVGSGFGFDVGFGFGFGSDFGVASFQSLP